MFLFERSLKSECAEDVWTLFRYSLLPLISNVAVCPRQFPECEEALKSSSLLRALYVTESRACRRSVFSLCSTLSIMMTSWVCTVVPAVKAAVVDNDTLALTLCDSVSSNVRSDSMLLGCPVFVKGLERYSSQLKIAAHGLHALTFSQWCEEFATSQRHQPGTSCLQSQNRSSRPFR